MSPGSSTQSSTGGPGSPCFAFEYFWSWRGSSTTGSYTRQCFLPAIWRTKTSCVSWWTASPCAERGVKYAFACTGSPRAASSSRQKWAIGPQLWCRAWRTSVAPSSNSARTRSTSIVPLNGTGLQPRSTVYEEGSSTAPSRTSRNAGKRIALEQISRSTSSGESRSPKRAGSSRWTTSGFCSQ